MRPRASDPAPGKRAFDCKTIPSDDNSYCYRPMTTSGDMDMVPQK